MIQTSSLRALQWRFQVRGYLGAFKAMFTDIRGFRLGFASGFRTRVLGLRFSASFLWGLRCIHLSILIVTSVC